MSEHRRTVVVTGSGSGMGRAVLARFERAGMRVIGIDLRDAEVIADLRTDEGCASAVNASIELCEGRLDGLVTCAGLGPHVAPTADIARVNYFGTVRLLDGLLPALAKGEAPAAVAFASNAASLTPPHGELLDELLHDNEETAAKIAEALPGITVYGTSKLGVVRAVRGRARSWGDSGVKLNAVAPGPVDTPMLEGILADPQLRPLVEALPVPLDRRATPQEIASAVAFLLDPANGYVHGSILFVDGGSDAEMRPDAI